MLKLPWSVAVACRYRVVSGVVYADHSQEKNTHLIGHRDLFVEILLTSIWLYKSFPDVDLWVSFADFPGRCNLSVPVLQYTIIGLDTVQKSKRSNAVQLADGSTVDVAFLGTGHRQERSDLPTEVQFHRFVAATTHSNDYRVCCDQLHSHSMSIQHTNAYALPMATTCLSEALASLLRQSSSTS
jgi:hypothetical protein